jgi:class 3 adenylate cyclase
MDYKIINEHMKNKFGSSDKIIELDNLTEVKINSITDTQMFKAHFSVLAIDLVGSKKLNQTLDVEIYNKLISEFVYGVSSIMKSYGGL